MNSPIRDTGTHDFSVRIHSEVTVSMQVQVKEKLKKCLLNRKLKVYRTDQNDAEKDIDKNETVISQKNGEG
ncbi:MAG: hypothetical protein Ct9H300mP28_09400 [Pseudomonadota bacterium]|nr:MAG: hypothetical protein Ct9H300mP28_09400 [Pseudomonadota bacterium]